MLLQFPSFWLKPWKKFLLGRNSLSRLCTPPGLLVCQHRSPQWMASASYQTGQLNHQIYAQSTALHLENNNGHIKYVHSQRTWCSPLKTIHKTLECYTEDRIITASSRPSCRHQVPPLGYAQTHCITLQPPQPCYSCCSINQQCSLGIRPRHLVKPT